MATTEHKPPTAAMRNARAREAAKRRTSKQRHLESVERLRVKTALKTQETQERIRLSTEARVARDTAQKTTKVAEQAQAARQRRVREVGTTVATAPITGTEKVVEGASGGSNILLIVGFFFALILVYLLVVNANATTGFLGMLGNGLSMLSQTTPLFVKKPTK